MTKKLIPTINWHNIDQDLRCVIALILMIFAR